MNAVLKVIGGFVKKTTNTGLVKPLPLTGLAKEFKELKESKFEMQKVVRFGAYILGGAVIYGVIWRGLPVAEALELLKALGLG